MSWQHRYELGDPMRVLERKQERAARTPKAKAEKAKQGLADLFKEQVLTQDESEQVESLLSVWYEHELAYRPALGAPRVSPSCRGHDAGDVHDQLDDRDAKINRYDAEAVGACIDDLPWQQRSAIGMHCRTRQSGYSVIRNPRIEDQHKTYQEAKAALFPRLKKKGLIK